MLALESRGASRGQPVPGRAPRRCGPAPCPPRAQVTQSRPAASGRRRPRGARGVDDRVTRDRLRAVASGESHVQRQCTGSERRPVPSASSSLAERMPAAWPTTALAPARQREECRVVHPGSSRTPRCGPRRGRAPVQPHHVRPVAKGQHEAPGRLELGLEALDRLPARGEDDPWANRGGAQGGRGSVAPAPGGRWRRAGGSTCRRGRGWSRGPPPRPPAPAGPAPCAGSYCAVRTSVPWQCRTKRAAARRLCAAVVAEWTCTTSWRRAPTTRRASQPAPGAARRAAGCGPRPSVRVRERKVVPAQAPPACLARRGGRRSGRRRRRAGHTGSRGRPAGGDDPTASSCSLLSSRACRCEACLPAATAAGRGDERATNESMPKSSDTTPRSYSRTSRAISGAGPTAWANRAWTKSKNLLGRANSALTLIGGMQKAPTSNWLSVAGSSRGRPGRGS